MAKAYAKRGFLIEHNHNHPPNDEPLPSGSDNKFRSIIKNIVKQLGDNIPHNNPKLFIYFNSKYYEYYPKEK